MYCKGNIYQIIYNEDTSLRYIGSTFKPLSYRFSGHKTGYKDYLEGKETESGCSLYKYFDKYGINNFSIILIKSYLVCREHKFDYKHLHVYEQLWISKLKCINENPCFSIRYLTNKSYYERNKERVLAQCKEYRNKPAIKKHYKQKHKEYREVNKQKIKEKKARKGVCECGQTINLDHKSRHIRTDKHIYNMMTDEEKKNYKPLKIQCPCGSMIRKDEKKRHEQTKKHISYIESI